MTCLGAADGTIVLLAAKGMLSHWAGAVATGLTVIGGVGAWIVARESYGHRRLGARDHAALLALALATSVATVAAAWLGDFVGSGVQLYVLPRAIGLVLLAVAVEVGGWPLRIRGAPVPLVLVGVAAIAEGVAQWTP